MRGIQHVLRRGRAIYCEHLSRLNNVEELFGHPHIDMAAFTKQDFIDFISAVVVDCLQSPNATIYNATKAEYASTLLSGKPYVTR